MALTRNFFIFCKEEQKSRSKRVSNKVWFRAKEAEGGLQREQKRQVNLAGTGHLRSHESTYNTV